MPAPSPDVFLATSANGGSTVGALLAPSNLLISASSTQTGPSDLPGSTFTSSVAQIGQQLTLADGNTGTVVDVSSDQSAIGNYALVHLASPESAKPLALSSAPVSNGQPTLLSNATSSYTTTIGSYYTNYLTANAPSGTGPDYQGIFLSPDGGTLLGLSTSDEFDRTGHTISGPAISGNTTALATIQQWLAADAATQPTAPVVTNPQLPVTQPTTPVVTNPPTTQPTAPDQPATSQNPPATVADGSTGQQMTCPAAAYNGPVTGLTQQIIAITAQNLNILAHIPGLFIHTGSGNDAIQAASGTNVLDGGTGSNFLTAGTGTDTFFVDARGATADTWSSIAKFHAGDAATLWGVSPSSAALSWSDNGGAAGYTGLTLHATAAGRPTASITLAGFSQADLASGKVTASFGHDAASGSDYLYLRGA